MTTRLTQRKMASDGGKARAAKLSKKRLSEIAVHANKVRWAAYYAKRGKA